MPDTSESGEVTCNNCGVSLGDQYKPGDGLRLFQEHLLATKNHTMCLPCSVGDHSFHSGGRLAFICIGCACEAFPCDGTPECQSREHSSTCWRNR